MRDHSIRKGEQLNIRLGEDTRADTVTTRVESIDEDLIWFDAVGQPLEIGQVVFLERCINASARTLRPMEVEVHSPTLLALRAIGDWHQVQERNFVRVSARSLPLEIVDRESGEVVPDTVMVDISAGGLCFETRAELSRDKHYLCRFDLGEGERFSIEARIVRVKANSAQRRKHLSRVAAEYSAIFEEQRAQITSWVYRQETRLYSRVRDRKHHR